jgi:transcriptional regulator with XRE-family HTH domain
MMDFSVVVEGLVATGMPPVCIASKLGVSRSTVCRWRQGLVEPRARAADALLVLAEDWTARRLQLLQKRNASQGI